MDSETAARLATLKRTTGKREMLVPGDVVIARALDEDRAVVDRVEERTSILVRRSGERSKTMAANIDTIAAVSALADPPPRLVLIDQLLAFAEFESLQALVLFTKPDLARPAVRDTLVRLYNALGYEVLTVNPKTGESVEELERVLRTRHAMLAGVSGVGKSSIFRALGGEAIVGAVSRHGLGKQTTTTARLDRTGDGFVSDSPGVSEFGLGETTPSELAQGFREMREPATRCRFNDCSHLREPDCAVLAAVDSGAIAASRYESYRYILLGSC
ncbi:MAG: hypothetical protein NVSMB31_20520 [Vulcanimicrobiaceae bacterium]